MYEDYILVGINQALNDELTSAVLYYSMSEYLIGVQYDEIRNEMKIHGDEEMEHFKSLLTYAYSHGLNPYVNLDLETSNTKTQDFFETTSLIQSLETKAIALYESLAGFAQEHKDIESHHFFKELMEKEMEHFDDIAKLNGDSRPLGKFDNIRNYSTMSFSDFLNHQEPKDDIEVTVEDDYV
jgi:ferritin